jgi:hypothetical protein
MEAGVKCCKHDQAIQQPEGTMSNSVRLQATVKATEDNCHGNQPSDALIVIFGHNGLYWVMGRRLGSASSIKIFIVWLHG